MKEAHDFFVASAGAAAAFIGLLFVAVTLAPERVFGPNAHPRRRADATRAFAALGNVFFISLVGLMPGENYTVMLGVAALSLFRLAQEAYRATKHLSLVQVLQTFGIISLIVYVAEFFVLLLLRNGSTSIGSLLGIILGLYAYALATSWGLLGAREFGETS
jgi:hypothetical protein